MSEAVKNILILGAAGRMGKTLVRCLQEESVPGLILSGAVDVADAPGVGDDAGVLSGASPAGINVSSDLEGAASGSDVIIDFSFHTGTGVNAPRIAEWGLGWVIGTTGLTADEETAVVEASKTIPIVMAPNMSLGVNLLMNLVQQAASALYGQGYDMEIVERHHRLKKDSPSGTALGLGKAAAAGAGLDLDKVIQNGREGIHDDVRPVPEIGFHAVRGGDFVGDHTVIYAGDGECIELSHRATRRETFALGALRAAGWVAGREPGLYTMQDVLGLKAPST